MGKKTAVKIVSKIIEHTGGDVQKYDDESLAEADFKTLAWVMMIAKRFLKNVKAEHKRYERVVGHVYNETPNHIRRRLAELRNGEEFLQLIGYDKHRDEIADGFLFPIVDGNIQLMILSGVDLGSTHKALLTGRDDVDNILYEQAGTFTVGEKLDASTKKRLKKCRAIKTVIYTGANHEDAIFLLRHAPHATKVSFTHDALDVDEELMEAFGAQETLFEVAFGAYVGGDALRVLAKKHPELMGLTLSNAKADTLRKGVAKMRGLGELDMISLKGGGINKALIKVAHACPRLYEVHIGKSVKRKVVETFIARCENLSDLSLNNERGEEMDELLASHRFVRDGIYQSYTREI